MAKGKKSKSKAKVYEVDFDGYEEKSGGYDGEQPKKGTYDGKLVMLNEHISGEGNEGLAFVFDITEGDYKGWRGWVYSNMDTAKWKTQQIVKAINGGQEKKFKLEPEPVDGNGEASSTVMNASPVRLRIVRETYDDEPRAKIRAVMPALEDSGKKDKKKGKKKKKSNDEPPF